MTPRESLSRAVVALAIAAGAASAACVDATTSTRATDVQNMKARWDARPATSYHYDFAEGGFFIYCPNPARVYVSGGAVDSAFVIATGNAYPAANLACLPTIDVLFQRALDASNAGELRKIRYDPVLGYPTEIDIGGPPDASGWYTVSGVDMDPAGIRAP